MGVEINGEVIEAFEVKTSSKRSDIYQAIGQLMVHSHHSDCTKIIVLPMKEKEYGTDITLAFKRLGIRLLTYELHEDSVQFFELKIFE